MASKAKKQKKSEHKNYVVQYKDDYFYESVIRGPFTKKEAIDYCRDILNDKGVEDVCIRELGKSTKVKVVVTEEEA